MWFVFIRERGSVVIIVIIIFCLFRSRKESKKDLLNKGKQIIKQRSNQKLRLTKNWLFKGNRTPNTNNNDWLTYAFVDQLIRWQLQQIIRNLARHRILGEIFAGFSSHRDRLLVQRLKIGNVQQCMITCWRIYFCQLLVSGEYSITGHWTIVGCSELVQCDWKPCHE